MLQELFLLDLMLKITLGILILPGWFSHTVIIIIIIVIFNNLLLLLLLFDGVV